jgi:hypothetical protein
MLHTGQPWPVGMLGCHTCHNPPCCNPGHIYPGTHQDNMDDMVQAGRALLGDRNPARLHPESVRRGEAVNTAKLSESDICKIRSMYADGVIPRVIGEQFGVSRSNVQFIALGKTWKHVTK